MIGTTHRTEGGFHGRGRHPFFYGREERDEGVGLATANGVSGSDNLGGLRRHGMGTMKWDEAGERGDHTERDRHAKKAVSNTVTLPVRSYWGGGRAACSFDGTIIKLRVRGKQLKVGVGGANLL